MERKELGRITSISFGFGGYDDAMFGVSIGLGNDGWGVSDFKGTWANWTKSCQWTKAEQLRHFGDAVVFVRDLCKEAKKMKLHELKGVPVEVIFEDNTLKSWRVLKEVL